MNDFTIQLQENESKGKVYIGDSTTPLAEMTFSKAGTKLLIIDHTEVDPSLKGHGVGRLLLNAIVKLARDQEKKIIPLCPFAKSVFEKDPLISEVLRG